MNKNTIMILASTLAIENADNVAEFFTSNGKSELVRVQDLPAYKELKEYLEAL